eukprot:gene17296-biopygen4932
MNPLIAFDFPAGGGTKSNAIKVRKYRPKIWSIFPNPGLTVGLFDLSLTGMELFEEVTVLQFLLQLVQVVFKGTCVPDEG